MIAPGDDGKIEPGKETFLDSWRSGVYDRVDVLQLPIFFKEKKNMEFWSFCLAICFSHQLFVIISKRTKTVYED